MIGGIGALLLPAMQSLIHANFDGATRKRSTRSMVPPDPQGLQHGPDAHLVGHLNRISIIAELIVCSWHLWLPGADPGRGRGGRHLRTRRPPVAVPGRGV